MYSNIDNENKVDVINKNLLDDDFSNISGCGVPPVCVEKKLQTGTKRVCKTILGQKVCFNTPTVKTVVNQACVNNKARYRACINDPNRKKLIDELKKNIKKAESDIKKGITNTKSNIKKVVTKLKDKIGKAGKNFRNKFRSVMRRGVLFNIKNNIHGTASRLFPAVATDAEVAGKKYKKGFVTKSRNMYSEIVNKWESIGGKESDLRDAIRSGHSKGFLKAPYKSFNGDDSYALYLHYTPSNLVYMENPNTAFYYNVEGDGTEVVSTDSTDTTDTTQTTEEVPSQEEKVHGIRAFFAWLKALFSKHKADDENPYADGTTEADQYSKDATADAGNEPDVSEANDPAIQDVFNKSVEDSAGTVTDANAGDETKKLDENGNVIDDTTDDTIMGIPKTGFWIGLGVLVLVGGFVTYKLVTKKGK